MGEGKDEGLRTSSGHPAGRCKRATDEPGAELPGVGDFAQAFLAPRDGTTNHGESGGSHPRLALHCLSKNGARATAPGGPRGEPSQLLQLLRLHPLQLPLQGMNHNIRIAILVDPIAERD